MNATNKKFILIILVLLPLAYLFGGYSAFRNIGSFSVLRAIKSSFVPPPSAARKPEPPIRFAFDNFGRLTGDLQKRIIPCPSQSDRTAVLLVMGQSNAGNHDGQRFGSDHGSEIVNFYGGQCFIAQSPLLGATGINGEYWTLLANMLVSAQAFDRVIVAPVAVAETDISRWARGGDLNPVVVSAALDLQAQNYRVTHVLWHQGETDLWFGTSQSEYTFRFLSVVDTLRSQNISTPIFVSVATKCLLVTAFYYENAVARAQLSLPNFQQNIRGGVNSDAILGDLDRYDDCHLSASGQQKIAAAWAQIIMKSAPR